jgi:monoamine oxidase
LAIFAEFRLHQFQTTMFQPVGGMDMIGKAFAKQIGDLIQYDAKVIRIQQNDGGVTVSYVNSKTPSTPKLQRPIGAYARSRFPF